MTHTRTLRWPRQHWPFDLLQTMWQRLVPLLQTALTSATHETVGSWENFVRESSYDRDPKRIAPLTQLLTARAVNVERYAWRALCR